MKKTTMILAILVGLSIASVSNAQTVNLTEKSPKNAVVSIEEVGGLKFKLALDNGQGKRTDVKLSDAEGNVLFTDILHGNKYSKVFDFSNLNDGVYTFTVECGGEKLTHKVEVATETSRYILAKNRK